MQIDFLSAFCTCLFSLTGHAGESELRGIQEEGRGGGAEPSSAHTNGPQDLRVLQCPHRQILVPHGVCQIAIKNALFPGAIRLNILK